MTSRIHPLALCTLLLACLTPAMSFIWHQSDPDHWTSFFAFTGTGLDGLAQLTGLKAYDVLGRMTVIVYVCLLLHLKHASFLGAACWQPRLLHTTTGLLALAALADVGTYWIAGSADPGLRSYFFWWVEVPALSAVVALTSIVGARALATEGPCLHSWLVASAVPVAVSATTVFQYLPHGMLVGLAWSFWGFRRHKED